MNIKPFSRLYNLSPVICGRLVQKIVHQLACVAEGEERGKGAQRDAAPPQEDSENTHPRASALIRVGEIFANPNLFQTSIILQACKKMKLHGNTVNNRTPGRDDYLDQRVPGLSL